MSEILQHLPRCFIFINAANLLSNKMMGFRRGGGKLCSDYGNFVWNVAISPDWNPAVWILKCVSLKIIDLIF